jgi:hypothetical protein
MHIVPRYRFYDDAAVLSFFETTRLLQNTRKTPALGPDLQHPLTKTHTNTLAYTQSHAFTQFTHSVGMRMRMWRALCRWTSGRSTRRPRRLLRLPATYLPLTSLLDSRS